MVPDRVTAADAEREAPVRAVLADGGERQRERVGPPRIHRHATRTGLGGTAARTGRAWRTTPPHRRGERPAIVERPPSNARPSRRCRSATAVGMMRTRESGSSTQSTGTSWMRSPPRWAITSSSVSKNQPSSRARQQGPDDVLADRLEAALGVGEARAEAFAAAGCSRGRAPPLGPAHHSRAAGEPAADRHVRAPRAAARPAAAGRPGRWRGRRPCSRRPARRSSDHASPAQRSAKTLRRGAATTPTAGFGQARTDRGLPSVLAPSMITIRHVERELWDVSGPAVQSRRRSARRRLIVVHGHDDLDDARGPPRSPSGRRGTMAPHLGHRGTSTRSPGAVKSMKPHVR